MKNLCPIQTNKHFVTDLKPHIRKITHTHMNTHTHTCAQMYAHTSTHAHTYTREYDESHIRNNHQLMSRSYFSCISAYFLSLHGYDRKKERRNKPPISFAHPHPPGKWGWACQGQQGMAGSQMQDGGATSKQVGISLPGTVFCVPVKFVSPWEEATMAVAHSEHTITLVLIMIIYN